MRLKWYLSFSIFLLLTSCNLLNNTTSSLNRAEAISGILYVVPEGKVTGGQVSYNIYEDGLITYVGDISYSMGSNGGVFYETQPTFHGTYKANPASVLSSTYSLVNSQHSEYKATFTVQEADSASKTAKVGMLVPKEEAFGELVLDLSQKTILFKKAEVTGKTLLGTIKLTLSDKKPE